MTSNETKSKTILTGLTTLEAEKLQNQYGKNALVTQKKDGFLSKALHIICEPMFLLLLIAAVIYFVLGEPRDGAIMLIFVIGVICIQIVQEWKTDRTLAALKDLSAPHISVIRDGGEMLIASADLVPGDVMLIAEGVKIPADGMILKCSDLCVDESSLTGESEGVWKTTAEDVHPSAEYWRKDYCYAGTLVAQGSAYVLVDKIGSQTEYGRIGANVESAQESPSPLQKQSKTLVKLWACIAVVLFVSVGCITWFNIPTLAFSDRLIKSILSGITLAMAMIPEEIPVILTVFLSMGAWRLAKKHSLVRKISAVETLGSVSVLCVDKTGTITMNQMTVCDTWAPDGDTENLCHVMGLACETDTYDPMEKAMLEHCEKLHISTEHLFGGEFIAEYSFTNALKMMGHIWYHDDEIIIAAKGSPEHLLNLCTLTEQELKYVEEKISTMSARGLRVIAVGEMHLKSKREIPPTIQDCTFVFCGIVGLADPPRETIKQDILNLTKAGVRIVMITGDNGVTASAIAKQIGMPNCDHIITGDDINNMSDQELRLRIKDVNVFSRVVPEHKMRIVKAFKEDGHVVAMTGDGVNDAPALKYADIGIAMGKRGSEVSREAADLILMDDNFSTIVDTIQDGRRIYDNIRKAVGYVFTIHIPIAFASLLAPLLNISPASLLLLPLHVVLMELIIDPTCSIVLERQPAERDIMHRKPRNPNEKIINVPTLVKSILQGLAVFIASFGTYFVFLRSNPENAALARTMGLSIIILANLFLVQVNSSNTDFALQSVQKLMKDKVMWGVNIVTIAGLLVILYTPISGFLKLVPLAAGQLLLSFGIAAASVLWYEIVKFVQWVYRNTVINN